MQWLLNLDPSSPIFEPHFEHGSYGDAFAIEYSVWIKLAPMDPYGQGFLDREMAVIAMEEFKNTAAVFGAMQGEMEYWVLKLLRMKATCYLFAWPPDKRLD